jgi:hypothetical protein
VFAGNLHAQKVKPAFVEKKNQNCLEFVPFPAFSYSYARKFNPKLTLGLRVQFGFGLRFLLTNPMGHYGCDQCPAGSDLIYERVQAYGSAFADYFKVESFYRVSPSKHIFIDAGLFVSSGSQMEGYGGGIFTGFEGAANYTFSAFHLGTKLMFGCRIFKPDNKSKIDYLGLFIVPIVIGINF